MLRLLAQPDDPQRPGDRIGDLGRRLALVLSGRLGKLSGFR
jgi:hypothetical protein